MDLTSPPAAPWQWAGLIISVVALVIGVVALPSAMQAAFGAPKLRLSLDSKDIGGHRVLRCVIHNVPVRNRALRLLRVHRSAAEDVTAHFRIREDGTGRVVNDLVQAMLIPMGMGGPPPSQRIRLAASFLPATLPIVATRKEGGDTWIFWTNPSSTGDLDPENGQVLPPGIYVADIVVTASEAQHWLAGRFAVGQNAEGLYWTSGMWS